MKRDFTEHRVIQIRDVNIGERIRYLREEKKLNQTDVVKQLQLRGVDISIYSYYIDVNMVAYCNIFKIIIPFSQSQSNGF